VCVGADFLSLFDSNSITTATLIPEEFKDVCFWREGEKKGSENVTFLV
jgi:hypothetical protein